MRQPMQSCTTRSEEWAHPASRKAGIFCIAHGKVGKARGKHHAVLQPFMDGMFANGVCDPPPFVQPQPCKHGLGRRTHCRVKTTWVANAEASCRVQA